MTDLNEDCLIDIFSYLSKEDLVNIVEYDKDNFGNAARIVFSKKFAKKLIEVTDRFDPSTEKDPCDVKLLTHFGDLIENLEIDYCKEFRRYKRLDKAILKNCSNSLVQLHITGGYQMTLSKITEPFVNVKKVSFWYGTPCDLVSDLNKWFPNANSLDMFYLERNDWTSYKSFIKHYPSLEHFGVSNAECFDYIIDGIIDSSGLKKFARLNPQLKSLKLFNDATCTELPKRWHRYSCLRLYDVVLSKINEALPNLEKLYLKFEPYDNACNIDRELLRFKNLKELTIDSGGAKKVVPILTDDLQVLSVTGNWKVCAEIMSWSSTVKKLKICGYTKMDLLKKTVMLPDLNEIEFWSTSQTDLQQITWLIKNSFKLSKITMYLGGGGGRSKCLELLEHFAALKFNEWDAHYTTKDNDRYCCFEKKIV